MGALEASKVLAAQLSSKKRLTARTRSNINLLASPTEKIYNIYRCDFQRACIYQKSLCAILHDRILSSEINKWNHQASSKWERLHLKVVTLPSTNYVYKKIQLKAAPRTACGVTRYRSLWSKMRLEVTYSKQSQAFFFFSPKARMISQKSRAALKRR